MASSHASRLTRGVRHAFLDFDGVLIPTDDAAEFAWLTLYESHRVPSLSISSVIAGGAGVVGAARAVLIQPLIDKGMAYEEVLTNYRDLRDSRIATLGPIPDSVAFLNRALRCGIQISIVSSAPSRWIVRWLRYFDLHAKISTIVSREDAAEPKPSSALYESAVRLSGAALEECIAIEDTWLGAKAALAAGLTTYVRLSPFQETSSPDVHGAHLIADLSAIPFPHPLLKNG